MIFPDIFRNLFTYFNSWVRRKEAPKANLKLGPQLDTLFWPALWGYA